MNRSIRTAAALAALLVFAGCTAQRVVDTEALEANIASEIESQAGFTPTSVSCPEDVPAQEGDTFSCTVTAEDGSSANVTVRQTDDQGSVTWEVDSVN